VIQPVELGLVSLLALGVALAAALPLLRGRPVAARVRPHDADRLEQLERRDRALAALRELELDRSAGTIGGREHVAQEAALRAEAAAALAALDARSRGASPRGA
jgi:hypothetical protein